MAITAGCCIDESVEAAADGTMLLMMALSDRRPLTKYAFKAKIWRPRRLADNSDGAGMPTPEALIIEH